MGPNATDRSYRDLTPFDAAKRALCSYSSASHRDHRTGYMNPEIGYGLAQFAKAVLINLGHAEARDGYLHHHVMVLSGDTSSMVMAAHLREITASPNSRFSAFDKQATPSYQDASFWSGIGPRFRSRPRLLAKYRAKGRVLVVLDDYVSMGRLHRACGDVAGRPVDVMISVRAGTSYSPCPYGEGRDPYYQKDGTRFYSVETTMDRAHQLGVRNFCPQLFNS